MRWLALQASLASAEAGPKGMRRRERQPIHGPGGLPHSKPQPRCGLNAMARPPGEPRVSRSRPERDAPARTTAHPWPRRASAFEAAAKVRLECNGSPSRRAGPSCPVAGKPESSDEGIRVAPPAAILHSLGSRLGLQGQPGRRSVSIRSQEIQIAARASRAGHPSTAQALTDEGLPMPQEPAWLTSEAVDGEAQAAPRERSPGWAQRTSGDGAWAAPKRRCQPA